MVGVLALPWLVLLNKVFSFDRYSEPLFGSTIVPESAKNAVSICVVIAFGYLLGSAVSRFSRDFFNDELWRPLPTEDMIRDNVYFDEFCSEHTFVYKYWSEPIHLERPPGFCDEKRAAQKLPEASPRQLTRFSDLGSEQLDYFDQEVQEAFLLEESELLLQGLDKVDRLKQYYDQITVLRGAAFNGFILFLLSIFGICGVFRARLSKHNVAKQIALLPASTVAVFVLYKLWTHWQGAIQHRYSDPPLAELVIFLVTGVGFFLTLKADAAVPYFRICILAAIVTSVSFGGWWWTEVMYDLQVIHSLPELRNQSPAEALSAQKRSSAVSSSASGSSSPTSSDLTSNTAHPN